LRGGVKVDPDDRRLGQEASPEAQRCPFVNPDLKHGDGLRPHGTDELAVGVGVRVPLRPLVGVVKDREGRRRPRGSTLYGTLNRTRDPFREVQVESPDMREGLSERRIHAHPLSGFGGGYPFSFHDRLF
jgi:hypothetical protein